MNSLALSRLVKLKNLLIVLPVPFVVLPAGAQDPAPFMTKPGRSQASADEFSNATRFDVAAFVGPVPGETSLKVLDQYFAWRRTSEGTEWAK